MNGERELAEGKSGRSALQIEGRANQKSKNQKANHFGMIEKHQGCSWRLEREEEEEVGKS